MVVSIVLVFRIVVIQNTAMLPLITKPKTIYHPFHSLCSPDLSVVAQDGGCNKDVERGRAGNYFFLICIFRSFTKTPRVLTMDKISVSGERYQGIMLLISENRPTATDK